MDNSKDNTETKDEIEVEIKELIVKKSRGRPRTKPLNEEPKVKIKPGRKTDVSKHKEYYSQYYRDNYQNNFIPCPNCWKPTQKCKMTRHMRTEICFRDQLNKRYINNNIEQYIESNKEEFDNFCNYLIANPDSFNNPKLKKSII